MGVPNFYSWLVKRYPMAQYDFNESHSQKTDFLFLDMNQVVYKCATSQSIIFKDILIQRNLEDVWIAIFNYINNIIDLVDPQQLLFIAFDGGAPRAKLNQQRQRRFQSAKHNEKINEQIIDLGFQHENDSYKNNQITSGTEFMEKLNQQIQFFIKRKFAEDQRWQKLKVLYSGVDVPGEGEHKIMDFIRNLIKSPNFCPDWTYMVYGADADLIMLGLTTHLKYFNILREKMGAYSRHKISVAAHRLEDKIEFQIINLQIVREYMDLEYRDLNYKKPYDINRIIDDFLLICVFVGNDFLPRVFCFDIRQGTLELLILLFKQAEQEGEDYINDSGAINWKEMLKMMKLLSEFEIVAMEQKTKELEQLIKDNKLTSNLKLIHKELDMLKQLTASYQSGDISQAKKQFYMGKCLIDFENNIQEIKSMVINYIDGIQFVLKYYYQGLPSWEWHYNFYYSPLCSEIYSFIQENMQTISACVFEPSHPPSNSFFELICKIPVSNAILLPAPYHSLLLGILFIYISPKDPESPLRKPFNYFPTEFEVDPFGAVWDHQYIVKIPFMDMNLLRAVFDSVDKNLLSEDEKLRQLIGYTKLYLYDDTQINKVQSLLPNIYKDFEVSIEIQQFDFNSLEQFTTLSRKFDTIKTQLYRAPSLMSVKMKQYYLKSTKDPERKSKVLTITHESSSNKTIIDRLQTQESLYFFKLLELWVYAGYPVQQQCLVLAVLTPQDIYLAQNYHIDDISKLYNVDYHQQDHQECYDVLKSNLEGNLKSKGISSENISTILIVIQYISNTRRSNGSLVPSNGQEQVLPLQQISFEKQYDQQSNQIIVKHFHDEFPAETKVILFTPQKGKFKRFNGCICEVKKTIPTTSKLVVKVIQKIPNMAHEAYLNGNVYYNIDFVAQELGLSLDVLLFVLGNVEIIHNKNTGELSDGLDVGLNVINMRNNLVVPELARMPDSDSQATGYLKFVQFKKSLELSTECVKLVVQYKKLFPQLFEYLLDMDVKALQKLNFIRINEIFMESSEPEKSLYQIYIWILQHPTSKYQQRNAASAAISQIDVMKLAEQVYNPPHQENCEILVNAGYVYREQQNQYVAPFYSSHPRLHELGSRVINLNSTSSLKAKFGATGTVIGLYEQNELLIEVLWDEPQIGFAMQSGRQPALRISIVKFNDVMNLSFNWSDLLVDRESQSNGWDNQVNTFTPQFKTKAIETRKIHKQVLNVKKLDDPFQSEFVKKSKTE